MINHNLRCIYVHIPKTAGNSVNRVFGVQWENHKDLARYAGEVTPEQFRRYYKFAIVRNPFARILSDYNYQCKKSRPEASKLFLRKDSGEKRNFREWIEAALAEPHRYPAEAWGGEVSPGIHRLSPQLDWLTVDGHVAVDEIIRLEELPESFSRICGEVGLPPLVLPHRNSRFHWPYSWYYDDGARRLVADYYARDLELLGYRFETPGSRIFNFSRKARPSLILTPSLMTNSCSP